MCDPSSPLSTTIVTARLQFAMRWVLRCVFAITLSIAGLSGCALFQKSAPAEVAPPAPLSAVTPAPEPTPAMSGNYPASKVAKQAAKAAEKARIAAQKAALASKEAAVASDEASQAAKQAELAVRMSQGMPPPSKHRKKLAKRASPPPVELEDAPSPTPTAEAPTPTVASQSQIPAETSTPASNATDAEDTTSLTSPSELVSSADAAQDHSSPLDTLKVIDRATASLKKISRSSLGPKDAERFNLASKLLDNARDSFTGQDYVAAQSLANKATVIIRLLPKSAGH
jgi:hypothetical protein